jgi:tRNA(Ile)-lysidine synthase
MLHDFETRFSESWHPTDWGSVTVVLAVSGGADSVALLRAMCRLRTDGPGRICVAHLNHRLRPEAESDEQFVRQLAADFDLPCEIGWAEASQIVAASGEGIEEAARRLRYDFLKSTAARLGARYVVTAHTADDQAETILQRIFRGTGLSGLSGIARTRTLGCTTLIRPLLDFRRAEIERYLADLGQPYRQDGSNFDCQFTRNRLRRELIPLLIRDYNPQAVEAILRLGSLAGEVRTVVDEAVEKIFERHVFVENHREKRAAVLIDLSGLETTAGYLLRELFMSIWRKQAWPLQAMGFAEWGLLEKMARESFTLSPKGGEKRIFPGGIQAETKPGEMRLQAVLFS